MPSFNPFAAVTGRNAVTLFDIRLESDFLVFRGSEDEAAGQLLKGVVALCVPAPIKVEDIHLRLTATQRLLWCDPRATPSGISNQKIDRTSTVLEHKWAPFWGTPGRSAVLDKGNYEFPFELLLPGDTSESVEGMPEASITYKLKATIARGKLAYDLHAYKHVRVVRTLDASALEFLHAMSVENIWPNKVEYSIVVPQKAIVFGSAVPLETRFTPLLKGLELGDISIRLIEIHDITVMGATGQSLREYKREKEVASWVRHVSREEHWQEMIEDTGQEGWVMNTHLDLPRKLGKCVQDVNVHGIKVRHKLKMVVSLKNPDGHISELRATLPITIFISPNIPLDEDGNLTRPAGVARSPGTEQANSIAPPGYGEHVLDQLYDEVEINGLQTPAVQSGVNSPLYGHSRAGSTENLAALVASAAVPPAALSSRLQDVSQGYLLQTNSSLGGSTTSGSGVSTPYSQHVPGAESANTSPPQSAPLSRHDSGRSGNATPEHLDYPEMSELCKVPSYATAIRITRVAPLSSAEGPVLPDYQTAISAPDTPSSGTATVADPLSLIPEVSHEDLHHAPSPSHSSHSSHSSSLSTPPSPTSPTSAPRTHRLSRGLSLIHSHHSHDSDADERQRLRLIQARGRVA